MWSRIDLRSNSHCHCQSYTFVSATFYQSYLLIFSKRIFVFRYSFLTFLFYILIATEKLHKDRERGSGPPKKILQALFAFWCNYKFVCLFIGSTVITRVTCFINKVVWWLSNCWSIWWWKGYSRCYYWYASRVHIMYSWYIRVPI